MYAVELQEEVVDTSRRPTIKNIVSLLHDLVLIFVAGIIQFRMKHLTLLTELAGTENIKLAECRKVETETLDIFFDHSKFEEASRKVESFSDCFAWHWIGELPSTLTQRSVSKVILTNGLLLATMAKT